MQCGTGYSMGLQYGHVLNRFDALTIWRILMLTLLKIYLGKVQMKSINFKMCPHGMLTLWGWVRFSSNSDHLHYQGWHVWPYEERSIMINVWECVGGFQSSVDSAWDRVANSTSINVIHDTHEDRNYWFESTQFHRIMYYILLYTISYYMHLCVATILQVHPSQSKRIFGRAKQTGINGARSERFEMQQI